MKLVSYYIMASSYRKNIYMKTDQILKSDFIIGEKIGDVKEMDLSLLRNQVFIPKRINFRKPLCFDKGVISFVRKNHYDTLVTGGDAYNISVWLLVLYCKVRHIKVIMWTHGYYGRETKSKDRIKKLFFSFADRIWVYGERAKKLLVEKNIYPEDRIDVVYNSLDYETQLALRNKMEMSNIYKDHFKNDNPVLVFLGRLTYAKKLDMIIEAANILGKKGTHFNIALIGDGEARESLQTKDVENKVWFYGKCFDETKLAELVYNADLCVSPGFVGLTAMHSMMFGCPVITHNDFSHQVPEYEAILEGRTGAFFEKDDVESLANTIEAWFDKIQDREKVRKECYTMIDEKYNPNVQIEIMKKSLESL